MYTIEFSISDTLLDTYNFGHSEGLFLQLIFVLIKSRKNIILVDSWDFDPFGNLDFSKVYQNPSKYRYYVYCCQFPP